MVYQAVVLSVMLYAVETWPVKQREVCALETSPQLFKNTIRYLMSFADFPAYYVVNEGVRSKVGLPVPLADMISCRRLCWLGHIAWLSHLSDGHLPKQLLFGWLPQC